MPVIDFNCYASSGIIKMPENDRDWYDKAITVVLLRQESTNTPITKRSPPPIGLAKEKFFWFPRTGVQRETLSFKLLILKRLLASVGGRNPPFINHSKKRLSETSEQTLN